MGTELFFCVKLAITDWGVAKREMATEEVESDFRSFYWAKICHSRIERERVSV